MLYRPSYLSGLWALSFFGLIPEKVVVYSSVTSRSVPRTFSNTFGTFQYSTVKQDYFFGFDAGSIEGEEVWLADPEKALLDVWYLNRGEWTLERMRAMRFQQFEIVNEKKLIGYAERFGAPRLIRSVENWRRMAEEESEGTAEL
jgi:predicted transcriptional regulator of viral defense system